MKSLENKLSILKDGYAPFCKHIFVENFTDAKSSSLELTSENEHLIRSKYEARNELELPVLRRYFPADKVRFVRNYYLGE